MIATHSPRCCMPPSLSPPRPLVFADQQLAKHVAPFPRSLVLPRARRRAAGSRGVDAPVKPRGPRALASLFEHPGSDRYREMIGCHAHTNRAHYVNGFAMLNPLGYRDYFYLSFDPGYCCWLGGAGLRQHRRCWTSCDRSSRAGGPEGSARLLGRQQGRHRQGSERARSDDCARWQERLSEVLRLAILTPIPSDSNPSPSPSPTLTRPPLHHPKHQGHSRVPDDSLP